ncbi:MAG: hypothetical protein JSR90_17865 [Proteobacteria bacterium]|nr:hypothetical protein [Pseudomonadota bacterium]
MARPHGLRQATTWAVAQKPKPMPRVVRLGRPANDNVRRASYRTRLFVVALATALVMVMLYDWRLI